MFDYKKYQRQSNFGCDKLLDARDLNEEMRDIERVNGMKAMVETTHDLLKAISSTVRLKGNKGEIAKLNELLELTDTIKKIFYRNKERFFIPSMRDMKSVEILDRDYFEKIRDIIDACYTNTEILMTRNKLLFDDSKDEFLSDDEIKKQIMDEYVDG
jgi:hypothetical protein